MYNKTRHPNQLDQLPNEAVAHLPSTLCHDLNIVASVLSTAPLIIDSSGLNCSIDLSSSCSEGGRGPGRGPVAWFGAGPHHFLCVAFRFDQKNVALGQEDAGQQAEAGGQDGKNLDGDHELATCAEVRRDKGDPHDEEDEHAEGHALSLTGRQRKKSAVSEEMVLMARGRLMLRISKVG